VYEDEEVIAFDDIHPVADVHILVVPKKHIETIMDMEVSDEQLMGHVLQVSKAIAKQKGLKGYKLSFNVGKEGGQAIMHVHQHLLGGKIKTWDF
jgi:histidine triad (HIT) family protein